MRRQPARLLVAGALPGGGLALGGCVIAPPRAHARVWIPGCWMPSPVWIGAHWRQR